MNGIPATLRALRAEMAELRQDSSVAGEAMAKILHQLDGIERCVGVILRMVKHLHGRPVKAKRGAAARTNRD